MIDNLTANNIRVFVFGTLRKGQRLDFYMEGSKSVGLYYTEGQLMKAETGSVYIDFEEKKVATIGEVHYVNFFNLQRINHLEAVSTEFPKGYDLSILPVWPLQKDGEYTFSEKDKTYAFFYRRRNNPVRLTDGDYTKHKDPILEMGKFLRETNDRSIDQIELMDFVRNILRNVEFM